MLRIRPPSLSIDEKIPFSFLPFGNESEMSYDVPEPYEFEEDYDDDYYGDKDYLEEEIEGIDFN